SSTKQTFVREVSIWKTLDHPNIVKLINFGLEPLPYISMELMEGTLRDILRSKGKLSEKEAINVISDIASALLYAHKDFYLVHRDIKPENILIKEGIHKLSDWGLAGVQTLISTSRYVGTIAYSAPEQFDPSIGTVSQWTDVWQLGVVLYELVAGEPPFGKDLGVVVNNVLHKDPIRPEGISDDLWSLIKEMLNKKPSERPSIADVIKRIKRMKKQ
ncbi:MAG: serine/threonine-protein kinase, partial [Candidatus Asgardarchaeia archaeon]